MVRGSVLAACALVLAACSSGGNISLGKSQVADPATVDYPIFYVKRPVPLNKDGTFMQDDLRIMNDIVPVSADLYMRASASASATEINVTSRITSGAMWDIKDVDTSADGTRVIFAMRGPLAMNQQAKKPPSWRIYEYVIATDDLHAVIDPTSDPDPLTVNDESPHYLPDGRIVFSTTRQSASQGILLDEGFPQFMAQDEARQESGFVLEVMNADGTGVHQITFNQSHDRDSTVLANGRVLWTRWDNAPGGRDQMSLYSANPDGTDLELYYGANSHMTGTNNTAIEFSHPRQMEDGRILAITRQYTDVDNGGDLVIIDGTHYVESTQKLLGVTTVANPAQVPATQNDVLTIPGPSPGGRFTSAYPLQDGTGRILVSWTQCRLLDTTQTPPVVVPCTSQYLNVAKPTVAPPLYSVWMFDPAQNTLQPIMTPVEGTMITDVAVAQPRTLQNIILDKVPGVNLDQNLVDANVGVIDIRSIYDIDGVDTATPNIATLANPIKTSPDKLSARFVRIEKPVSIPDRTVVDLNGAAFGASNYMMQILGYAPVEPDGSVKIEVPANVAFRMEFLDANARRIGPNQTVWLQVKAGEVVQCNGCHQPATTQHPISHGRQGLFTAAWAGAATSGVAFPGTLASGAGAFIPNQGETMAQARMRISCSTDTPPCAQMVPSVDVLYKDVWTDPAQATPGTPINLRYDDATQFKTAFPTSALCVTGWSANCRIIINYPEHLQPLWDLSRQVTDSTGAVVSDHTCTQGGCHAPVDANGAAQMPAGNLDLTKTASTAVPQQTTSYQQLLFAHNISMIDPTDPTKTITQSVGPYLNAGSANGGLSSQFMSRFAAGSASTHAGWLSPDELRLVSEWLDIGAQYFNNPFDPAVPVN
ncbi:MAG: hypothetical protein JSS29_07225 [Proteobacteria bacterium]|nr:hypothetical protein [Pseudomonadota bacterium]